MAATVTYSGDWLENIGALTRTTGTLTLGSYATGGVSVTPAMLGLGSFTGSPVFSAQGYVFAYDATAQKVLAFIPAGTVSKPSFTVKNGTIGSNMTTGITADSASANFVGGTGVIADRTLTTTSPVGTPTFTGAALAEVGAGTDLSGVTVTWSATGK